MSKRKKRPAPFLSIIKSWYRHDQTQDWPILWSSLLQLLREKKALTGLGQQLKVRHPHASLNFKPDHVRTYAQGFVDPYHYQNDTTPPTLCQLRQAWQHYCERYDFKKPARLTRYQKLLLRLSPHRNALSLLTTLHRIEGSLEELETSYRSAPHCEQQLFDAFFDALDSQQLPKELPLTSQLHLLGPLSYHLAPFVWHQLWAQLPSLKDLHPEALEALCFCLSHRRRASWPQLFDWPEPTLAPLSSLLQNALSRHPHLKIPILSALTALHPPHTLTLTLPPSQEPTAVTIGARPGIPLDHYYLQHLNAEL